VTRGRGNANGGLRTRERAVNRALMSLSLLLNRRWQPCLAGCIAIFVSAYEPARADGLDWALPQVGVRGPPAPTGVVTAPSDLDDSSSFLPTCAAVAKQAGAKITFARIVYALPVREDGQ